MLTMTTKAVSKTLRKREPEVIPEKTLSDSEKFKIIAKYSEGIPAGKLSEEYGVSKENIRTLVSNMSSSLAAVEETNRLIAGTKGRSFLPLNVPKSKFLNQPFLDRIEDGAAIFAYFLAATGDAKFALESAGLHLGVPANATKQSKEYVWKTRAQYLLEIPEVKRIMQEEYDKKIKDFRLDKPDIQIELLQQIQELKNIVPYDPRQRGNLLKSIELLGRTIGAFTDRVEVEEVDAKSGLQLLMERARAETKQIGKDEPIEVYEFPSGEKNE
jgi:hypothetical protein